MTFAKFLTLPLAGAALALGTPVSADHHGYKAKSPEVVERNEQGKATKVKVGDRVYPVCMSEQQDSCINPRAAGLNWGDKPLPYWPANRS